MYREKTGEQELEIPWEITKKTFVWNISSSSFTFSHIHSSLKFDFLTYSEDRERCHKLSTTAELQSSVTENLAEWLSLVV